MKITVYFDFKDAKPTVIQNATVVLADVLRSTSTMALLLYHGAEAVNLCPDAGTAKKLFEKTKRGEGILAGERDWKKIPGFHLGGSPLDSSREKVKGRTVLYSSSSPLRPLKNAKAVFLGAFLNLNEVYEACLKAGRDVVIVCAGGKEDAVFAGMLTDFLQSTLGGVPVVMSESAKEAVGLYRPWQGRLIDLLRECEEGKALTAEGYAKDLDFCAKVNKISVLPYLKDGLFLKADLPKPKKSLFPEGKKGGAPQKGKSIKVTVPLFPKNPEHPVPGMEKSHGKKHPPVEAVDKKKEGEKKAEALPASGKKPEHPKEAPVTGAKGKKALAKPVAMFSKKTVATYGAPKKPEAPVVKGKAPEPPKLAAKGPAKPAAKPVAKPAVKPKASPKAIKKKKK